MEWIKDNSDVMMVVLTGIYVIATILVIFYMNKSNTLTAKLHRESLRPYVIFDVVIRKWTVYFVVKNIGKTAAHNIHISTNPKVIKDFGGKSWESPYSSSNISFLAPDRMLEDLIYSTIKVFKETPAPKYVGVIEYEDSTGKKFSEKYEVDLEVHREITSEQSKSEIADQVKELTKIQRGILKELKNRKGVYAEEKIGE